MAKQVRSARGELVDFDLLRIKENLGSAPKASTVKAREDFIDNKFKRRLRRMAEAAQTNTIQTPTPASTEEMVEEPVVAPKKKIVKPAE